MSLLVQTCDQSDLVLDQSDLVLMTLCVFLLRGFVSGAGVQTDGSETSDPLSD